MPANVSCVFPFLYNGNTYNECAWDIDGAWCSTETNVSSGQHIEGKEGACDFSCPIKPHSVGSGKATMGRDFLPFLLL